MVGLCALLIVELRAIHKDRLEYAQGQSFARNAEQQKFDAILKQDQSQFDKTVSDLEALISSGKQVRDLTLENLNNALGETVIFILTWAFPAHLMESWWEPVGSTGGIRFMMHGCT